MKSRIQTYVTLLSISYDEPTYTSAHHPIPSACESKYIVLMVGVNGPFIGHG